MLLRAAVWRLYDVTVFPSFTLFFKTAKILRRERADQFKYYFVQGVFFFFIYMKIAIFKRVETCFLGRIQSFRITSRYTLDYFMVFEIFCLVILGKGSK